MASDTNTCVFSGRIGRINDLGEGKPMYVSLAVNNYKGQTRGDETSWLDIVVFDNRKPVFTKGYASKGRQIIVTASAESREVPMKRPDGSDTKVTLVNFVAQSVTLGAEKRDGGGQQNAAQAPAESDATPVGASVDDGVPF